MYIRNYHFFEDHNTVIDGTVGTMSPYFAARDIRERIARAAEALDIVDDLTYSYCWHYVSDLEKDDKVPEGVMNAAYDTLEDMQQRQKELEEVLDGLDALAESLEKLDEAVDYIKYLAK